MPNKYTEALYNEEAFTLLSAIAKGLNISSDHVRDYMATEIAIPSHDWDSFWALWTCFLAEVDDDTVEALRLEMILGILYVEQN